MKCVDSLETAKSKIRMWGNLITAPVEFVKVISLMLIFWKHLIKIVSTFLTGCMIVTLVPV